MNVRDKELIGAYSKRANVRCHQKKCGPQIWQPTSYKKEEKRKEERKKEEKTAITEI